MSNRAGRPSRGPAKAVRLTAYIQPETLTKLGQLAEDKHVPLGVIVDRLVSRAVISANGVERKGGS